MTTRFGAVETKPQCCRADAHGRVLDLTAGDGRLRTAKASEIVPGGSAAGPRWPGYASHRGLLLLSRRERG